MMNTKIALFATLMVTATQAVGIPRRASQQTAESNMYMQAKADLEADTVVWRPIPHNPVQGKCDLIAKRDEKTLQEFCDEYGEQMPKCCYGEIVVDSSMDAVAFATMDDAADAADAAEAKAIADADTKVAKAAKAAADARAAKDARATKDAKAA